MKTFSQSLNSITAPARIFAFGLATACALYISNAYALDINGKDENGAMATTAKDGVVSLYLFDEAAGSTTVLDQIRSSVDDATAVDLTIDNPSAVQFGSGALQINIDTAIRSTKKATKIIDACKGSNEITVEAWIESNTANDLSLALYGPARIMTLSTGLVKREANGTPSVDTKGNIIANTVGFYAGQTYDGGHEYVLGVNTTQTINTKNKDLDSKGAMLATDPSDKSIVNHGHLQHVHFIKNKDGVAKIFVGDENHVPILRRQVTLNGATFDQLDANSLLVLGNEPNYLNDASLTKLSTLNQNFGTRTIEDKDWRGKYHMMAIYCKALTDKQVLANLAPSNWLYDTTPFEIDYSPITDTRRLARVMYSRLTGIDLPIFHPSLIAMENLLKSDPANINNRIAAAQIATSKPAFYNLTVKQFAKEMSNREHLVTVPLNDFTASFIGVAKNNEDARELLRGNFYYRGDPTKVAVPSNLINDLITSNRHYETLEMLNYDLSSVLIKVPGQVYYNGVNNTVPAENYDVGGVLTSRQWMAEHAIAGTNRRLIEFSFSEFLCRPITAWADNTQPDNYVGRDVDRYPAGDHSKYQISCRGCHAQMDAFRGAFARLTFETGFVKHAYVVDKDAVVDPNEANNNTNIVTMVQVPTGISGKMNKNNTMFPDAKETLDSRWDNYVVGANNATYFGWNPASIPARPEDRRGVRAYGNMLAESKAFSTCMTERAFQAVCKRAPKDFDRTLIESVAASFRNPAEDNYKLKKLFERMASQSACLGK